MITKLYDFRQTAIPAALLQAEVSREDMAAEQHMAAARFTTISAVEGAVEQGDVVALEFADEKQENGVRRIYVNVGKGFDDAETCLPGLICGQSVQLPYAGKTVEAKIVSVKRPCVPELNDGYVQQLGIANVSTMAEFEEHTFQLLAQRQRKRKFQGIMGLVSKAMMANTEFAPVEEDNAWYVALRSSMVARGQAYADREGKTFEEVLPLLVRMPDKSTQECYEALKQMCIERAKEGALGQAYAKENGVEFADEGDTAALVGKYVDYLSEVVFNHFAPQIAVTLQK